MKKAIKGSLFALALGAVSFPALAQQTTGDTKNTTADQYRQNDGADEYRQNATADVNRARNDGSQTNANNTMMNVRDRDDATMTPLDQGTSPEDVDATASIRKDIIAREGLSVDARNVKVITRDGRVTLRGPVKSVEEKNFIAEAARARLGVSNVDDQIEVIAGS